ncbi:dihydroorotate dehydrogenase electron transfer subunit [Porphyromonas macacae]|uniref:dihydroorotate dehydrogenase electron transfer subunit n=1 Tax=Porphyromonas macacae TaxID=28115 RepID=UPI0035A1B823
MKKSSIDFFVSEIIEVGVNTYQLRLFPSLEIPLNEIIPGQFVEVLVPDKSVFLRRPISVCDIDPDNGWLDLLIAPVGPGTRSICGVSAGDCLNIILPLGNGFDQECAGVRPLLVGGGVGTAPMLYFARKLSENRIQADILLGGRTRNHILLKKRFEAFGHLCITTDDGSLGEKGLVTAHSVWDDEHSACFVCGPTPMMKAVSAICEEKKLPCYVSLENKMACGIGACLCCVQDTKEHGNVCVCTDGPVFLSSEIKW